MIAIVGAIATYIDNYYTTSVGQWVANDLRIRIYEHLHRLSLGFYDTAKTGALMSTITSDVSTVQDFASSSTLGIVVDLVTIVFMLGLMFWLDWDFTLIAVGVTPFLLMFVMRFKKAVKEVTRTVRVKQSEVVAVVQEGLGSVRAVKAFGRQDLEIAHMQDASHATVAGGAQGAPGQVAAVAGRQHRGRAVHGDRAVEGHRADRRRHDDRRCADRLPRLPDEVLQAGEGPREHDQRDRADDRRAGAHPEDPRRRRHHPRARGRHRSRARSRARSRSSTSRSATATRPPVLTDVSFTIKPGQVVGIVGPTGSGKSTVVSLMPRFYDPTGGRVLIDGVDIATMKLAALRAQIGFVLQETVLFRGTIRENIAYGRPGASDEEIVAAAKLANADEFIARMPHGYDSVVGERGDTLSGGQRQRIGIARAVIRNSPIMILDEPTAALDTESEKLVIEGLERLMKGRTVIMIAHRLSTIRDADKIIVLKDGVVAEEGTNDELIARGGVYAELHRIQFETPPAQAAAGLTPARRRRASRIPSLTSR